MINCVGELDLCENGILGKSSFNWVVETHV